MECLWLNVCVSFLSTGENAGGDHMKIEKGCLLLNVCVCVSFLPMGENARGDQMEIEKGMFVA